MVWSWGKIREIGVEVLTFEIDCVDNKAGAREEEGQGDALLKNSNSKNNLSLKIRAISTYQSPTLKTILTHFYHYYQSLLSIIYQSLLSIWFLSISMSFASHFGLSALMAHSFCFPPSPCFCVYYLPISLLLSLLFYHCHFYFLSPTSLIPHSLNHSHLFLQHSIIRISSFDSL